MPIAQSICVLYMKRLRITCIHLRLVDLPSESTWNPYLMTDTTLYNP